MAFVCAIFICLSFTTSARVRFIYVHEELKAAKTIRMITVVKYAGGKMYYRYSGSKEIKTIDCSIRQTSESNRLDLVKAKTIKTTDLAGKWPDVGQAVLMVVDTNNRVCMFAKKSKGEYRFWDPNSIPFANSIFVFPKQRPYLRLEDCKDGGDNNCWECTDGCRAIEYDIIERG